MLYALVKPSMLSTWPQDYQILCVLNPLLLLLSQRLCIFHKVRNTCPLRFTRAIESHKLLRGIYQLSFDFVNSASPQVTSKGDLDQTYSIRKTLALA
jgi:hypothetical protein